MVNLERKLEVDELVIGCAVEALKISAYLGQKQSVPGVRSNMRCGENLTF